MNNEYFYQAIKTSMIDDINIAYELFRYEEYENLKGVIFQINVTRNFGKYLKDNPDKIIDLSNHLKENLKFQIQLVFVDSGDEEFFPLLD